MEIISLILTLIGSTHFFSAEPVKSLGWRGLVPLHSTRADVERLLGQGKCTDGECSYYLNDMNVFIHYSRGDCKSGKGAWDVPPDTIISITVYPKPRPLLSDLKIDENKYKKKAMGHIESITYYENEEEGVILQEQQGLVGYFIYGPTVKEQHLRCPEDQVRPFLSFSFDIPEEQQKHLVDTLNLFVEYSQNGQYERQYELFLPEYAAVTFPVKNKQEFAEWVRTPGAFKENWVTLKPSSAWSTQDKTYGKVYDILLDAKTLENGNIIKSSRITRAVIKDGQWYFIGLFLIK